MTEFSEPSRAAAAESKLSRQWSPILVGIDGTERAARAVDTANGLAADLNTELWIANVIDRTSETAVSQFARRNRDW
jgi:Universal stress protein family